MWDPQAYLTFADHRGRPFFELLARVGAERPRRVIDLGCGPGNLTGALARRWPEATLEASDSSPEMVRQAQDRGLPATVLDVRDWKPAPDVDVVVCNAVLQWVPEHPELLTRWISELAAGGWFAMQVPGNFDAPSHREVRALAGEPRWQQALGSVLRSEKPVLEPAEYAELLTAAGATVDVWETTYLQRLTGDDPVLEWITGTALRPIRAALDDPGWQAFRADLAPRLRAAYPQRADGSTWFPFRRLFAVAHKA